MVRTVPRPVSIVLNDPYCNLLQLPERRANPYFHIAEAMWMFAGLNDVDYLLPFNKTYGNYAEADGRVFGAYGHRWLQHFEHDQIQTAVDILSKEPHSRQVVIAMWDGRTDLTEEKLNDRPCNTQIMLRVINDRLDMLVTNRSNDLIWGALGANVVHFTMLQIVLSNLLGLRPGRYQVISNNLHYYPNNFSDERMTRMEWEGRFSAKDHRHGRMGDILTDPEANWSDFSADCRTALTQAVAKEFDITDTFRNRHGWVAKTGWPLLQAYIHGKGMKRVNARLKIQDHGIREACRVWESFA